MKRSWKLSKKTVVWATASNQTKTQFMEEHKNKQADVIQQEFSKIECKEKAQH